MKYIIKSCELRRKLILAAGIAAMGMMANSLPALSDSYPSRSIKLVVPYSAGSGADIAARMTMAKLATILKQSIVIENRPGSSAMAGTDSVAKASADGYTLLFGVTQHAINPTLQPKLPYDTQKDFIAVSRVTDQPLFLATSLPVDSVTALVKLIKENPGKYNYASTGVGTSIHLSAAYFAHKAGLKMTHVPYSNTSQAVVDLGRGEVQLIFYTYQPLMSQVQLGHVKILGTTGKARSAWAPNVPTMAEAGIPDFIMPAWHGVFAPAGTPPAVVEVLEKGLAQVAADPDYRKKIEPTGTEPYYADSKDFTAYVKTEIIRFRDILHESDAKL
jgi:tripartite-type tricarboxylate transporter receptor subunit TctC